MNTSRYTTAEVKEMCELSAQSLATMSIQELELMRKNYAYLIRLMAEVGGMIEHELRFRGRPN
jgi:hypothetical protein